MKPSAHTHRCSSRHCEHRAIIVSLRPRLSRHRLSPSSCFSAHVALLVGVTTPEKFYFDEVHYVPAARQMLEPVMPSPMLNPMHPPLAKQMIALSIRIFGDEPLGWRYPGALFGALAVVAIYLCGLALFARRDPRSRRRCSPSSTRCCSCSRGSRCWIFSRSPSACWRSQRSCMASGKQRPHLWFALGGLAFGLSIACKWSGLFPLGDLHRHRRRDPADAGLAHAIRRRQCRRLVPAGSVAGFQGCHFAACFVLIPALVYLATFVPLYGLSLSDILEAQRRIFTDNTTTAIAGQPI